MDSQLAWITEALSETGVEHWLDSGTLLGLVRDGQLIASDPDIDLAIWDSETEALLELVPFFVRSGYRVEVYEYDGSLFALKLFPRREELRRYARKLVPGGSGGRGGFRFIDICVFHRTGAFAWNPQKHFLSWPYRSFRPSALGYQALKVACYLYKAALPVTRIDVTDRPWRSLMQVGTWWIPAEYYRRTTRFGDTGYSVPSDFEGLLHFRYGDWRVPVDDWIYQRDDGGYRAESPAVLLSTVDPPSEGGDRA